MRLAIIGSREYPDLQEVADFVKALPDGTVIVSGGAKGVDTAAAEAARARGLEVVEFRPNYKLHGRGATFIRNREILENCDAVVAFWDGRSRGTKFTIDTAERMKKPLEIVRSK